MSLLDAYYPNTGYDRASEWHIDWYCHVLCGCNCYRQKACWHCTAGASYRSRLWLHWRLQVLRGDKLAKSRIFKLRQDRGLRHYPLPCYLVRYLADNVFSCWKLYIATLCVATSPSGLRFACDYHLPSRTSVTRDGKNPQQERTLAEATKHKRPGDLLFRYTPEISPAKWLRYQS